jgi:hypothetical protein
VIKQGQFDLPADTFSYEVNSSPLSKRSWAFQARLLSRRIVHFGSSLLFFECNTLYASELEREGIKYDGLRYLNRDGRKYSPEELRRRENMGQEWLPRRRVQRSYLKYNPKTGQRNMGKRGPGWSSPKQNPEYQPAHVIAELYEDAIFGYRGAFDTLRLNSSRSLPLRQQLRLHQRWFELIAMYTKGQLTQQTDRLIGISGIARAIQAEKDLGYVGGLWEHHLLFDLLWCLGVGETPKPRPTTYRAPSWSWVSVEGRIFQQLFEFTPDNENKDCRIEKMVDAFDAVVTKSQRPTTSSTDLIDGGHLDLRCRLIPIGVLAACAVAPQRLVPDIATYDKEKIPLKFVPDIVLSDPSTELFCVELLRMSYDTTLSGLPSRKSTNSTHGLVLQRIKGEVNGWTGATLYERVGKFQADLTPIATAGNPFGSYPLGHPPFEILPIEKIRIL